MFGGGRGASEDYRPAPRAKLLLEYPEEGASKAKTLDRKVGPGKKNLMRARHVKKARKLMKKDPTAS